MMMSYQEHRHKPTLHSWASLIVSFFFLKLYVSVYVNPEVFHIHLPSSPYPEIYSKERNPRAIAHQAHLSMELSRQEYWSRWPFPSAGNLPNPGIKPRSPTLQANSLPSEPPGKLQHSKERAQNIEKDSTQRYYSMVFNTKQYKQCKNYQGND